LNGLKKNISSSSATLSANGLHLLMPKEQKKQTLLDFSNSHNSHYVHVNKARILSINNAMPLTEDMGVIEPNQL
jgi:hypothetical protein